MGLYSKPPVTGRPELLISCLCVTHDRDEFVPWVVHQFQKQGVAQFAELVIVHSGMDGNDCYNDELYQVVPSEHGGISPKRTAALVAARAPFITWFDDDDWQSPRKLEMAMDALIENEHSAAGSRHAYMYSVESGRASLYESTYEPIIFNSAVYRKNSVPQNFDSTKITGEDTEWCERWLKMRPSYVTLGEPTHAWLCHGRNIVNKANSRFFQEANPIPFDEWELEFLERMRAGRLGNF